jgi:hypothetical protein
MTPPELPAPTPDRPVLRDEIDRRCEIGGIERHLGVRRGLDCDAVGGSIGLEFDIGDTVNRQPRIRATRQRQKQRIAFRPTVSNPHSQHFGKLCQQCLAAKRKSQNDAGLLRAILRRDPRTGRRRIRDFIMRRVQRRDLGRPRPQIHGVRSVWRRRAAEPRPQSPHAIFRVIVNGHGCSGVTSQAAW